MNFALHEAIAFQTAQRLRQHFLRDASDLPVQGGITHRAPRQDLDDESGPFVGDAFQHNARRTLRIENGVLGFGHEP